MNPRTFRCNAVIFVILIFCIIACGRGHRSKSSVTEAQNNITDSNNSIDINSKQTFQPFPAMPEGDYPKSTVRKISQTEFAVSGKDQVASVGALNKVHETDPNSYVIIADKSNELAYAQYNVAGLTTARPVKVGFELMRYKETDEDDDLPLSYFIGVADYTNYAWEWNGPYTDKDPLTFTLIINSKEKRDRYVDKFGTLHFVVITSTKDTPKLSPKGRVGVAFKNSTTTINSDYVPNNPHYTPIKNIYTGKKSISSLSSINLLDEPFKEFSQTPFANPCEPERYASALVFDQYITLEWEHVPAFGGADINDEASKYQIFRKGPDDVKDVLIGSVDAPSNIFIDPVNLAIQVPPIPEPVPGVKYEYFLRALTPKDGFSPKCFPKTAIAQILAPTGVKATVGNTSEITVSWDETNGAVEYEIWASYTANDKDIQKLATIPAPFPKRAGSTVTYSDTSAELGKLRYYRIKAVGKEKTTKEGVSASSIEVYGVKGEILFPPTDVAATDGTDVTKITVTWKAPKIGTAPVGYSIWQSTTETGVYNKVGDVGNVLIYNDLKVPTSDTYWYKVKATKSGISDSNYSNADSGVKKQPVMPPVNVKATDGDFLSKVQITWDEPSGLKPEKYYIYRSAYQDKGYGAPIGFTDSSPYDDNTVPDGATYWFKVTSFLTGYPESGKSTEDNGFITQLSPPQKLTATDGKYLDKIKIDWIAPSSGPKPDGYLIYRSTKPDVDFVQIADVYSPTNSWEDSLVPDGFTYYYKAICYKATYQNSVDSNVDAGYVTQLTAPKDVKATDGDHIDKITITLTNTSVQTPDGYNIYRAASEYGTYEKVGFTIGAADTDFDDLTVPDGYTHFYKVTATKTNFPESLFSDADSGYLTQLQPPTNVNASDGYYNDKVNITWEHPKGQKPDGYDIYRADTQTGVYNKIGSVNYVTEYTDDSVTCKMTLYWYKVISFRSGFTNSTFSVDNSGWFALTCTSHLVEGGYGYSPSLVSLGGKPAISHGLPDPEGRIRFLRSKVDFPSKSEDWVSMDVDVTNTGAPSLHIINSIPVISYEFHSGSSQELRYAYSSKSNPDSITDWEHYTIDTCTQVKNGSLNSINSLLSISYYIYDNNGGGTHYIKFAQSNVKNPTKSSDWSTHQLYQFGATFTLGKISHIYNKNNLPLVFFKDYDGKNMRLLCWTGYKTKPASASDWTWHIIDTYANGLVSDCNSTILENGNPVVTYQAGEDIKIAVASINEPLDTKDWNTYKIGSTLTYGYTSVTVFNSYPFVVFDKSNHTIALSKSLIPIPNEGNWLQKEFDCFEQPESDWRNSVKVINNYLGVAYRGYDAATKSIGLKFAYFK